MIHTSLKNRSAPPEHLHKGVCASELAAGAYCARMSFSLPAARGPPRPPWRVPLFTVLFQVVADVYGFQLSSAQQFQSSQQFQTKDLPPDFVKWNNKPPTPEPQGPFPHVFWVKNPPPPPPKPAPKYEACHGCECLYVDTGSFIDGGDGGTVKNEFIMFFESKL